MWRVYAPLQGWDAHGGGEKGLKDDPLVIGGRLREGNMLSVALMLKHGSEHQGVFFNSHLYLDRWSARRDLDIVGRRLATFLGIIAARLSKRRMAVAFYRWHERRRIPIRMSFFIPPSRVVRIRDQALVRSTLLSWKLYVEWARNAKVVVQKRGWVILRLIALKARRWRLLAWNRWYSHWQAERRRAVMQRRHFDAWRIRWLESVQNRMRGMPSEDFLRISRVRRAFLRWHTVARRKRVRLLALRRLLLRLALRQWLTILRATILADTFRKWVTSTDAMKRLRRQRLLRQVFILWKRRTLIARCFRRWATATRKLLSSRKLFLSLRRGLLRRGYATWLVHAPPASESRVHGAKHRCIKCMRRYGRLGARESRQRQVPDRSGIVVSEAMCHVDEHLLLLVRGARDRLSLHGYHE